MENTQRPVIYSVSSDIDDGILYAEFETEEKAIEYAKQHMDKLPFVDRLEVSYDANGDIDEVFEYTTVWDHTMVDGVKPESEEDYWDMLTQKYEDEEDGKHVIGDTTWFESMDNLVETLEESEDEVECKECFDLYPKADCIKLDFGYICPVCAEAGSVSEEDIFKMDFPEYEKMSTGNDMIPEEPTIPVESDVEVTPTASEDEIDPISTPEEAVPFLVNDEEEAVAGYEKAAEVVEASDLANKEEILDTIEHIKEEEEEHIEELTDLVEPTGGEVPENENDPISEDEVEEIEDPEAEPVEEAMSDSRRQLIATLTPMTKDEFQKRLQSAETVTIFTGDPREIGIRSRDYEASYEDGKYVVSCWEETYNDDFTESEVIEEFDTMDELWAYMIDFMEDRDFYPEYNYLAEELTEHVNQENPAIESDQELGGTDNAVVDCKVADVVSHSEDEKPVDYEGKKKPLTEATTAEMQEIFKLCKEIGIDTGAELTRFAKEEVREGESLLDRLKSYRAELGDDFKIEEDLSLEYEFKPTELQKAKADVFKLNAMKRFEQDETLPEIFALYQELQPGRRTDPEEDTYWEKRVQEDPEKAKQDFLNFYRTFHELRKNRELYVSSYDTEQSMRGPLGASSVKFKDSAAKKKLMAEAFTKEEQEEFNMDEDGNSLDSYDTYVKCSWCEDIFTESECDFEYHMGWLCDRCQSAITSRGEKLTIITNPTEEDKARTLTEAPPAKFGAEIE